MVHEVVELPKEHGALEFGDFVLSSGERSPYYLDVKKVVTNPVALQRIGAIIAGAHEFDVVAGVAVGGIPLAVAVALAKQRPFAIVRKEEKGHGKAGRIIGDVGGRRVLLVEDVTTSGGSALDGVRALRAAGGTVELAVTGVDREAGAAARLAKEGVRLEALARASEILRAVEENSNR
ncbi:MAG: orotate phosphoribosyltransferase [Methanolinea sp.]